MCNASKHVLFILDENWRTSLAAGANFFRPLRKGSGYLTPKNEVQ